MKFRIDFFKYFLKYLLILIGKLSSFFKKQHYHNYYPFDEIMRYKFYDIIAIIENCAIMEAELANVRQMYGNDSSSGSGVVGSSEERLVVGVVSRRSTAAVAAKKRARQ